MSTRKKKNTTLSLVVTTDIQSLACDLVRELSHELLFEFIKEIDEIVAEWGFTDMLIEYFQDQADIKAKEDAEMGAEEETERMMIDRTKE